MDPRTAEILRAAIREFITTGTPVSSAHLYRRYRLPVKPATIRNELSDLTEGGYLVQPHTSSGRVPTDKGYQFLVDALMHEIEASALAALRRDLEELRHEFENGALEDFVADFAEEMGMVGAGYVVRADRFAKSGLHDLFGELSEDETMTLRDANEVIRDFESLEERMAEFSAEIPEGETRVFIGKSPLTRSRRLSVIAGRFPFEGSACVFAAIGPKRMNYDENLKLFMAMGKHYQ